MCQFIRDQSGPHPPLWDRTMDILVSASQCATFLTWAPAPCLGSTLSAPLLIQNTSVAAPLLIPGPSFLPGTQAPITMQGPALPQIPSMPITFSGALRVPGSMQSTGAPPRSAAIPPMTRTPWPSQAMPYASASMS